jgi:ribonuclease HII
MPDRASDSRLQRILDYEEECWGRGLSRIAGVDEAGRGPLAGPVVAAAVVLRVGGAVPGVIDSKQLSRTARERLFHEVMGTALAVSVGAASVREIDRLNILSATTLAMNRALDRLGGLIGGEDADHVVVDGLPVRGLKWRHEALVGGDARVHSVACASVVAKVVRDRLMRSLARRYPGYGWESNVGYGTAEHMEALRRLGPTPHHRLSFGGVQMDLELD